MTRDDAIALHGQAAVSQAAQHALWRAGDLTWLLDEGQLAALAMVSSGRARRYVLAWARRRGKTWFFVAWAFMQALMNPKGWIPYAAPTGKMVADFVVPIATLFANTAPADLRPEVVGDEIRFHNGAVIPMYGCEDERKADRLRGNSAVAGVIDEGGFIPVLDYVVRSVMLPMTLTTDGVIVLGSTPPTTPAHPFTALKEEAERRGAYMHLDVYSNPGLTPQQIAAYCEECGGPQSATFLREGLALFVTDPEKAIVPEWAQLGADGLQNSRAIVGTVPRPAYFDAYVVGDLGYVDLTVILFAYWHFDLALIVVEAELVLQRSTSAQIQAGVDAIERELWCVEVAGVWRPLPRQITRIIDAPPITRADMASLQEPAVRAAAPPDGPPLDWSPPRKADRAAGVNALRLDVQRRAYAIHPRCRTLISHLQSGVWNERRTDFERSADGGHNDGVAAAMYLSRSIDRQANPYPPPTFNRHEQFVPPAAQRLLREQAAGGWAALTPRKR